MKTKSSASKTLLASMLLSAPGPLVLGIGLILGQSSTAWADFVRRFAELAAIVVAFLVYRKNESDPDTERKALRSRNSNRLVAIAMIGGGLVMIVLSLVAYSAASGSTILPLIIAVLGAITNGYFWRRYRKLGSASGDSIVRTQGALYRAKTFVDLAVVLSLLVLTFFRNAAIAPWIDRFGSIFVAIYLVYSGLRIFAENKKA